jgi:hypothetical protein
MLKWAKAKQILATGAVYEAVDLCAEAAYDAIGNLTSQLLPDVPVDNIDLVSLFHVCDLQCPNQHGVLQGDTKVLAQTLKD